MKKTILLLTIFLGDYLNSFTQASNESMLFVIDSIPLIKNPEDWNQILDEDISDMSVIKSKDSLKLLGFGQFDGVTYVFTKEYRNRPDSIKKIPSLRQMKMENDAWNFQDIPYSGKYIDYYNSGRKLNEGTLLNGKLNGQLKIYYQNGYIGSVANYKNGMAEGVSYEYYKNGALSQQRGYKEGRDDGKWENYFPDGHLTHSSTIVNGKLVGLSVNYFSTGKIDQTIINNRSTGNIDNLMGEIYKSQRLGDSKSIIKICSKIIKIDSSYVNGYFYKGVAMLDQLHFDEAVAQFDKALMIEPFFKAALTYRAMARIRKYEFGPNRILSENKEVTVVASKKKVPISAAEIEKICIDLKKVDALQTFYGLGDWHLKFITESLLKYCNLDTRR